MNAKNPDHVRNRIVILDFDGTLYHNPTHDFSLDIPIDDILDAYTFFSELIFQTGKFVSKNAVFALITGRIWEQEQVVLHYLTLKGYRIDHAYFVQTERTAQMDETSFLIEYWTAKVKLINQLNLSDEFESIIIIDDDPIICSMLEKLNFEVYKAEISKDVLSQTLSITFTPPQKLLMSELQALLKNREEKKEKEVAVRM